ncbi:MAG TPA: HAD-IC family P-type ATPase, partial [Actinomycetes bacterium]|nr:HAD-IC family P-type ATPase [Actinomycetes bacterium]
EVAERVAAGQTNAVRVHSSRSAADIVRANVLTRFNAIIGVLFLIIMVVGPWQDGLFGLVVVANTAIGIVQELRAKWVLDRLSVLGAARPRVRRDGRTVEIPRDAVVHDDLVVIGSGDQLVVDGPVLAADGLELDESLLTGEADPVPKQPGDQVLSGSFVVAGIGSYRAARVGAEAYAAALAAEARSFQLASSELRAGINRILGYIWRLMLPVGALLVVSQLASNDSLDDALRAMVAGLVTMVPEGLVLLTSMAFAVGVIRLGRRRCLVQELPAIEVLARVDVVCTDKTGTLTEKGLRLRELIPVGDDPSVTGQAAAALGALVAGDPDPNPTARAIAESVPAPAGWRLTRRYAFSSARKWSAASFRRRGRWLLGAAETLLPSGDPVRERVERLAATGARVLLLARWDGATEEPEPGSLRPAALVRLEQRVRSDAPDTVAYFADQGVTVKVLSGDSAAAAGQVAAIAGVAGADRPVDAQTLTGSTASDSDSGGDSLAAVAERTTVFGRISPQQKRGVLRALRANGHIVAMTGDGVNDVLALKNADVAIAMGSGSGAARAVAQIVLLDDAFASLPQVVAEGRRVVGNIERVARLFLTKTVYSLMLAVLVGIAQLPFPFLPRQLTLVGALTIGIPAFVLALAPNADRARPGFVRRVLRAAIPAGVVAAASTFAAYAVARADQTTGLTADRTVAVIALTVVALWVLAIVARPYTPWRIGLVLAMAIGAVGAMVIPPVADFFALVPSAGMAGLAGLAIGGFGAGLVELLWRRIGVVG